jgi:hypothetical protein
MRGRHTVMPAHNWILAGAFQDKNCEWRKYLAQENEWE